MEHIRIGIVGGRTFKHLEIVEAIVKGLNHASTVVVSGGADGVDKKAIDTAKELQMKYIEFIPETLDAEGYKNRNTEIVNASEKLIGFVNKESRGTWDTIRKAKEKGIPVIIINEEI